jgi:hypothetical protein
LQGVVDRGTQALGESATLGVRARQRHQELHVHLQVVGAGHPPQALHQRGVADVAHRLGELFDKIKETMPRNDPGSLSAQDAADVVSWLLQLNQFPAGQTELPADLKVLNLIKIE